MHCLFQGIRPPPIRGHGLPTHGFRPPRTVGSTSGATQVQHYAPSFCFRQPPIRPTASGPAYYDSTPIGLVPLPHAPSSNGTMPRQDFIQFMTTPRLPPRGPRGH